MTAQRPDGKSGGQRVSFTRQGADRIARVVRTVEAGDKRAAPLRFGPRLRASSASLEVFRICTFTGSWDTGVSKTVTFKYQTSTPNTVSALNLFADVPAPDSSGDCAVARENTSWFLIAAVCVTTTQT